MRPKNRTHDVPAKLQIPSGINLLRLQTKWDHIASAYKERHSLSAYELGLLKTVLAENFQAYTELPGFSDELVPFLPKGVITISNEHSCRSEQELVVFASIVNRVDSIWAHVVSDPLPALIELRRQISSENSLPRSGAMFTARDRDGSRTRFPAAAEIGPLLQRMSINLTLTSLADSALSPLVAYLSILHAHPFSDGNGRTARLVLHLGIANHTGARNFVPLHYLNRFYGQAFIIKTRRAVFLGDWTGITDYMHSAVALSNRLGVRNTGADNGLSPNNK